jgi:hypothetical protein
MLLDDDVMADGQAKPGPFPGGLRRKERVEQLLLDLGRYAGAVVADSYFHPVTEILGRGSERLLVVASIRFSLTLRRRIEAVRDQIQEYSRDPLRETVNFTCGRIQRTLERDVEPLLLGPRPVIGEVEALLDQGVDIDWPVLPRTLARVQQHVLDNRIGALAVLHDLVEVAPQGIRKFGDCSARLMRDEARKLLAPVNGWFTEGFDTLDLKEAKALLEELVT